MAKIKLSPGERLDRIHGKVSAKIDFTMSLSRQRRLHKALRNSYAAYLKLNGPVRLYRTGD